MAMGETIVLLIRQLYKISTDSIPVDSNDSLDSITFTFPNATASNLMTKSYQCCQLDNRFHSIHRAC